MTLKKIVCVIGTRPEAIKMSPIILALKREPWADVRVMATAQHRHILDQVLSFFKVSPDIDLNIMSNNQSLAELTSKLIFEVDKVLEAEKPDVVLIQGDTTTVMSVALACFYRKIKIGHVEAGLRTWDIDNPFPEEANRVITSKLSKWHFAPTDTSRLNLIRDGVIPHNIHVTGNTVIDALLQTANEIKDSLFLPDVKNKIVLITAHRRENFGKPFVQICEAIKELAKVHSDIIFYYSVHPNPNIHDVAHQMLGGIPNILLREPLDYGPFVAAMKKSYLILTDSGGVQEEAPALGKPVFLLREETERPEAVDAGAVIIVGPNKQKIITEVSKVLVDSDAYDSIAKKISPYGDGNASKRIVNILRNELF